MFVLYANKTQLTVRKREPVTSGSVNIYRVRFEFSQDWDGLTRKAVFKGSGTQVPVLLDETGECDVPWEVLVKHGGLLLAGVYGTADETALPTTWASLGTILEGVTANGEPSKPPTPDLWQQELDRKGDKLDYDGLNLSLMSGDKPLSTVQIEGGSDGTTDHRLLGNRDAEDQHPIKAITSLSERLDNTMTIGNTLSVAEILRILEV